MSESDGERPSGTIYRRTSGSQLKVWILLSANRWTVAAVLLIVAFTVFVITMGVLDPAPFRQAMESDDPVETLFQAFVTTIITGVTLVVTLNQVVLSQELGAVGDQRDRMEASMTFRKDVEAHLDEPISPHEPSTFLRVLIEAARSRAHGFETAVFDHLHTSDIPDDRLRTRVNDYVGELDENAWEVIGRLEDAQFGTFDVLFAVLDFDYSWKIFRARHLGNEYREALPDLARETLDELVQILEFFGIAREHFKTIYFQWELINLSRAMLYAGIPALVVAASAILILDDPNTITGSTLGIDNLIWTVAAASTVALTPFMILTSYVLRIATVAKRTLAIGPFILHQTQRTRTIDRSGH